MRSSLYVLVVGFLAGVLWRSFFDIGLVGVCGLVCGIVVLAGIVGMQKFHAGLYVMLFCIAVVLGIIRTEFAYRVYDEGQNVVEEGFIATRGWVDREPDVRNGYVVLVLRLETGVSETPVRVRVKVPSHPAFRYGERVEVSGELQVPRAFETDTGRVFDYPGYLMKEGVHYELKEPHVSGTGVYEGSRVQGWLLALKHAWLASVSRLIPEPGSALAGGLVVGAKQSLGEEWLELFRITGIIHIVVLSGYNLTLIADSIVRVCRRLPRLTGLVLGVCGIVGFALMAGMSATVVRASVMAVLALVAAHVRRPHAIVRLLALAAFVMVCAQPFVLVFDTGFQLSFMATLGLIVYAPRIESWCTRIPEWGGMRSIVAATCATQFAVLPLLLYQMGQVSLVAPIVNLLILPIVPSIMFFVFLSGVLGMVSTTIALPGAWIAHYLLRYVFWIVDCFGQWSFAAIACPPVPWWSVVCVYVLMGGLTYRWYKKPHGKNRAA